jgi:hypothetical protein
VYSRADLSRTLAIAVALFSPSTGARVRHFRADTIKQTRASAIELNRTKLE